MKRISLLVLAIVVLPVPADAQSVTAGAGYEVALDTGELSFEVRYSRNLTDAFDDDPFDINSFQGLIGYGAHVQ
jgi:hypothetical protein